MNRRSFFKNLALAAAAFTVLPSATTYARKWVVPVEAGGMWIPNPEYVNAEFEMYMMVHPGAAKGVLIKAEGFPALSFDAIRYKADENGVFTRVESRIFIPTSD